MNAPKPPYFAVIFTSTLKPDAVGYEDTARRMVELASAQPGFLGFDSARGADGTGITVSYWSSLESIRRWKAVPDHARAQAKGRAEWYSRYRIQVAEVKE